MVGASINRYTTRRYVDHGVLHVYLTSASLKNELGFVRDRLMDAINRWVGADVVKEIVFH